MKNTRLDCRAGLCSPFNAQIGLVKPVALPDAEIFRSGLPSLTSHMPWARAVTVAAMKAHTHRVGDALTNVE